MSKDQSPKAAGERLKQSSAQMAALQSDLDKVLRELRRAMAETEETARRLDDDDRHAA